MLLKVFKASDIEDEGNKYYCLGRSLHFSWNSEFSVGVIFELDKVAK